LTRRDLQRPRMLPAHELPSADLVPVRLKGQRADPPSLRATLRRAGPNPRVKNAYDFFLFSLYAKPTKPAHPRSRSEVGSGVGTAVTVNPAGSKDAVTVPPQGLAEPM